MPIIEAMFHQSIYIYAHGAGRKFNASIYIHTHFETSAAISADLA